MIHYCEKYSLREEYESAINLINLNPLAPLGTKESPFEINMYYVKLEFCNATETASTNYKMFTAFFANTIIVRFT